MKIRDRFQPTVERDVDEGEHRALEQQGHLWSGTDKELAELHEAAGLTAPAVPAKPAGASATATDRKEGAS